MVIGKVIGDHGDGKLGPVLGAAVRLKGTNTGVITNADGKFVIDLTQQSATGDTLTLSIGFIGYTWRDIKVTAKGGVVDLDIIVLENDPNALTGCSYSRRPFLGIVWYRIKSIFSKDF